MALADEQLDMVRMIADVCVSAFFAGKKKKEREENVEELFGVVTDYVQSLTSRQPTTNHYSLRTKLAAAAASLRSGDHPILPFHWDIEFPEVLSREQSGFDGFVGNPPFAGKNTLTSSTRAGYINWLKSLHAESHGNSDVVAHFFRRAFSLLGSGGRFGLIATNTIRQGDTRSTGLKWICQNGGCVYNVRRRLRWPGLAAVVVSVVHVARVNTLKTHILDGKSVDHISAYLFHSGTSNDPVGLQANRDKCFIGFGIYGAGFTFEDGNPDATSISRMHELIRQEPRNADRIRPYIGGEEINDDREHSHKRYVICFDELTEEQAREWPDLMAVVEQKVRPEREKLPPKNSTNKKGSSAEFVGENG